MKTADLHRRMRGMTLIEVIVAMAVLSLIVLVLGASLRGMAKSAQRIDERVDLIDEMRVASAFLRDVLGRVPEPPPPGPARPPSFVAAADQLSWVAVMPARYGAAGRYHFRLALEPLADASTALVLRYAPWQAEPPVPDWAQADSRVLARDVQRMQLRYGGEGMADGWRDDWAGQPRLPPRLRLDLSTAGLAWPTLVVPIRVQSSGPGGGGFVIGGSTR